MVVGSRGPSTINRVVMGRVSESVVSNVHCSVLVVRVGEQNTSTGGSRWVDLSR
ncbi:MAG TPA: universal stress protein [Rubrobacter sp.]|nr:universal stress protein [Rubrobacter sp.]